MLLLSAFAWHFGAFAAEIVLAGTSANRAILVIDGNAPLTLSVGARTRDGLALISVSGDTATIEIEGRRQILRLGASPIQQSLPNEGGQQVRLYRDIRGHYYGNGQINRTPVRFIVDTGASLVSLGKDDAARVGIDVSKGESVATMTANGVSRAWKVKLDRVTLGPVELVGVDALVHDASMPFVLLGMSFLNRMDLQHEGDQLLLRKRY